MIARRAVPSRDVRVAQFAVDTVRVVLELAGKQAYVVRHEDGEIRVERERRLAVRALGHGARGLRSRHPLAAADVVGRCGRPLDAISDIDERIASLPAPTATLASQTSGLAERADGRARAAGHAAPADRAGRRSRQPITARARVVAAGSRRVWRRRCTPARSVPVASTSGSSFSSADAPAAIDSAARDPAGA